MKKTLLTLIALITILANANTALAEEWVYLFEQEGNKFYLDQENINKTQDANQFAFWLQVLQENPMQITLKPLQEVRMQQIMDCKNHRVSEPIKWENRNEDGQVMESGEKPEKVVEWMPLEELDGGDDLLKLICGE